MLAYRYPISPLGLQMLKIGDLEIGWAIKFDREELIHKTWQTGIITKWLTMGCYKTLSKAHIKYVFKSLVATGIHFYEGDHERGWDWDFCTHPDGLCPVCDCVYVVSHPERVTKYGTIEEA